MYKQGDYLGHYQAQVTATFTNTVDATSHNVQVHYEQLPNTSTFSPNPTNYAAPIHDLGQQHFLPIAPDVVYQTGPVPGFPGHWLTTPEPSLAEAQVEQFQQLHSHGQGQQDLGPLTPWPSMPNSNSLSRSSEDGGVLEDTPEEGEGGEDALPNKKKERKERRRAQNRVAQRLFRARREVSLKESSQRLETLEDEVGRLQSNNDDLSDTVSKLKSEVTRLRKENSSLKRRLSVDIEEEAEEEEEEEEEEDDDDDDDEEKEEGDEEEEDEKDAPSIFEQMRQEPKTGNESGSSKGKGAGESRQRQQEQQQQQQGKGPYFTRSSRDRRKGARVEEEQKEKDIPQKLNMPDRPLTFDLRPRLELRAKKNYNLRLDEAPALPTTWQKKPQTMSRDGGSILCIAG